MLKKIFSADLRSLAFLRVSTAIIILADLFIHSRDLVDHYTDFGILPRISQITSTDQWYISIHLTNGTWQFQALLFGIAAFLALLLLVGYKTTLATVVSWFLLYSLQIRNPDILQGGDAILRMLLFWGIFLPWGARYSIDSIKKQALKNLPNKIFTLGILSYIFQVAFIFWFTALWKIKTGNEWLNGTAIYYALNIDQMTTPLARFLLQFPGAMKYFTYGTLAFESLGPFLLFSPYKHDFFRIIALTGFYLMLLGIALFVNVGLFLLIAAAALLGLIPTNFWDKLFQRLKEQKRFSLTLYYDGDCGFCKKTAMVLQTFFLLPHAEVLTAENNPEIKSQMLKNNSWVVVDENGSSHFSYEAFLKIALSSPILIILFPLFWIMRFGYIGEKIYRYVSNHRKLNGICHEWLNDKNDSQPIQFSRLFNILAFFFLIAVLLVNIAGLSKNTIGKKLESLRWLKNIFFLGQQWSMFSPNTLQTDGWTIIPGTLKNGNAVDLMRNGAPLTFAKPAYVPGLFKNYRWRKYFMNLQMNNYGRQRKFFAQYLCRKWNATHQNGEKLTSLEIIYMFEKTLPDSAYSPPEKREQLKHNCPD